MWSRRTTDTERKAKRMAKYYKLIDAVSTAETFCLPHKEDGRNKYGYHVLRPGKKYDEYADDEVFVAALRNDAHKKIPWTQEREDVLKATGARYEVAWCRACGGRSKKIDVWLVEVVE